VQRRQAIVEGPYTHPVEGWATPWQKLHRMVSMMSLSFWRKSEGSNPRPEGPHRLATGLRTTCEFDFHFLFSSRPVHGPEFQSSALLVHLHFNGKLCASSRARNHKRALRGIQGIEARACSSLPGDEGRLISSLVPNLSQWTLASSRKTEVSIPRPLQARTVFETGSAPSRFVFQQHFAESRGLEPHTRRHSSLSKRDRSPIGLLSMAEDRGHDPQALANSRCFPGRPRP